MILQTIRNIELLFIFIFFKNLVKREFIYFQIYKQKDYS